MSDNLQHFGILGMRWGRRSGGSDSGGSSRQAKKLEKADKKWEEDRSATYVKAHNAGTNEMNAFISKMNKRYEKKNVNMFEYGDNTPSAKWNADTKAYVKEYDTAYEKSLNKHAKNLGLDISPSKKKKLVFEVNEMSVSYKIVDHKEGPQMEEKIKHAESLTENALQHYGKLGMKWGKRLKRLSRNNPISKANRAYISKIKKESHPDNLEKIQLKKKKLHAMSNEEITKLNKRLQLEKQYKELNKAHVSSGKKIVGGLLLSAAKQSAASYIASGLSTGIKILAK